MDAPMTPREAVAWLVENTAAARKTYCIILRSTNGVHNPGTRGMLICGAAALSIYCTRCDAQRTYYARPGEDYADARRNALAAWNTRKSYD